MNSRLSMVLGLAIVAAPAFSVPAYAYTEQQAAGRISTSDFLFTVANTSYYATLSDYNYLYNNAYAWNGYFNDPNVPAGDKLEVAANLQVADQYLDACQPDLTDANSMNEAAHWWFDNSHWDFAYQNADGSIDLYNDVNSNQTLAQERLNWANSYMSQYGYGW